MHFQKGFQIQFLNILSISRYHSKHVDTFVGGYLHFNLYLGPRRDSATVSTFSVCGVGWRDMHFQKGFQIQFLNILSSRKYHSKHVDMFLG